MHLHVIGVATLLVGTLAGGCGSAQRAGPPQSPSAVVLTEHSKLEAADEIDGLDLAEDASGALHLVWRERRGGDAAPRGGRIVYRRGSGTPLRWTPPVVIAEAAEGRPRVVAGPDGAHVIAGPRLSHWRMPAAGGPIEHLGTLLDGDAHAAGAFDAVMVDGRIVIAFTRLSRSNGPVLFGMRWSPDGRDAPRPISAPETGAEPGRASPELHRIGRGLMVLWTDAVAGAEYDETTRVTTLRTLARLSSAWSNDGGRGWSRASNIVSVPQSDVDALAATGPGGSPEVFFAADGLFQSRWTGAHWSPPTRLADDPAESESGRADVSAVAATLCQDSPVVAWVDARHRRSDRRWWNPLGGFPWSDDPDWDNNDLFVRAAGRLHRLTQPGSYTGAVAIARRDADVVVIHAGRAQVGKSRHDSDAPSRILQSRVPCG
jgi:hypothetical protein